MPLEVLSRFYNDFFDFYDIEDIQWNLSKADTFGTNIFVRFRQVSALDRLNLWDFDQ